MIIRPGPPPGAHNTAAMQQVMQQQAQIQQLQQQQAMVNSAQYAPPPHPIPAGTSSSFTNPKMSNVKRKKIGGNGGNNYWANSRAFAGFKGLITLALVGMSNLDCLSEISECIKASSATLKSLTLSLSTELARKSRKPAPVNPELDELSDTEQDEEDEEEDTMNTQPPASGSQPAAPTNEADIRKEKIAQESILAKVFDLQSVSAEGKRLEKNLSLPGGQCLLDDENQEVIRKVNDLMKALMDAPIAKDLDVSSTEARMTHFQMIREVAELYIASQKIQQKKEQAKSILQSSKKPPTASKSLNPLASGFKPSSSSKPLGSTMDYEFQEFSSPSSPFYDPGSATWSNGTPKPYGASSSWSMVSPPPPNLPGGSNTKTAPSQAYTSPYVTGSYPVPPNPNLPYPYEHSNHSSSGVQSPPIFSPNTLGSSNGQSSFAWTPSQKDKESILSNAKNAMAAMGAMSQKEKTKAKVQKKPEPPKAVPVAESDDETVNTQGSPSLVTKPFFASNPEGEPADDGMEFDMEHPDEETADLGEDQVIIAGGEESPAPRKRAKVGVVEQINTSISVNAGSSSKPQVNEGSKAPSLTSDEAMQAYIRAAHGLQLEELSLEWIPLKASIVARALDLSVLKRVTLLEVGTQDAFWTLLVRLQSSSRNIAFNSIHTDNVSVPFLKFLATYKGLKELFMYERNTKQDVEAAAGTAVGIALIRNRALKIHISTLERVTIRNERAESWDVDPKTLRCLVQGTKLTELAFSLNMKTYVSTSPGGISRF